MKKRRSLQKQEGKSTDKEQAGPGRRTIHPRPHDGLGHFPAQPLPPPGDRLHPVSQDAKHLRRHGITLHT